MAGAQTRRVEVAVVGAGVVGLACAAALARRGRGVLVIEREPAPGRGISSRNSEVIHAGLYYPPGSLKARTCVDGRERLYARCRAMGIPHRRLGKLVVAVEPEEIATLEEIRTRGLDCGAGALELLDAPEVARREPRVRAAAALWSPESGIVDAHALVASYQAEAEAHGAQVVAHTAVVGLDLAADGSWSLHTRGAGGERYRLEAEQVVNAAGLEADRVAELAGLDTAALGLRLYPCKGDYFAVAPALGALTRHLVYPVPAGPGLGIHVTMDLAGRFRLGPDAEYVEAPHYAVDPAKAPRFAAAAARYLPEITAEHLAPDIAGVRPKRAGPGEGFRDFALVDGRAHGAPGLVSLVGIESPGLTAAGALAERVATALAEAM